MTLKNTDFFFYYKILINLINKVDNFKKTYFLLFFILLLSSSFFEMSILGFLYVLIKAFLDPGYYSGNFIFQFAVKLFNIKSSIEFINYLSFFFIIVCIFAGFVRIYFNYIATRLVYFFGKSIANSCYLKLIYQEYKSFFNNNTSSILSIFQKLQVMNNSIYNTIFIIYNFFTFLFIFLILFYINWVITISSTFVFCTLYLLIIYFFKKKILHNGKIISDEQGINLRIVRETFNGFRDILINNYQNFYIKFFKNSYEKLVNANEKNRFTFGAPRPIIETFLLICIGFVIIVNSKDNNSLISLLPILSVLAVASQRILPVINQLYAAHVSNLDALPAVEFIYNFISQPASHFKNKKIKPLSFKKSVTLRNVCFSYDKNKNTILENINLHIPAGTRVGIIGKSGSGKSTLVDLILGTIDPDNGDVLVDGKSIKNKKQSWFKNVASVPQNIFVTEETFAENIAFGEEKKKINYKKVKRAAEQAQISEFIELKEDKYNSIIGEKGFNLSVGQRQRIAIARSLYKESKLIIFDEATSSLDEKVENLILETIFGLDKRKYTLIIISHKLSNLKKCDLIFKINNKKIVKMKNGNKIKKM